MRKSRQDAWTKDEDVLLAEIVLRHIQKGKTQLEAFKQASEALSRTPAACGFRWNAAIRKKHLEAIETAKSNRKNLLAEKVNQLEMTEDVSIDSVITLLEKVKESVKDHDIDTEHENRVKKLEEENKFLQTKVRRYEEAWKEMGHVWQWIRETNGKEKEMNINHD